MLGWRPDQVVLVAEAEDPGPETAGIPGCG
jgi:hypothetical protein